MIQRQLSLPVKSSFMLFGPRQTGKSTLLRQFFKKNFIYIDLLRSKEFQKYSSNPDLFTQEVQARDHNITHIIVDEIQRVPDLLNEIHFLMEQPKAPFFCLSGSSARKLKRAQANLLAGRALNLFLYPLTHKELDSAFNLNKAMSFGTLPVVYGCSTQNEAVDILNTYVEVYLKEEIQAEALTRNIGGFIRFLDIAADINGGIVSYNTIARDVGITYKTVQEYYQILEDTLIGFYLLPYAKSVRKRLIKHPKFYFFDLGVVRAIRHQLSVDLKPKTYEYGRAFEHFIIAEAIRLNRYLKKDYQFSFYNTTNSAEVDLIIETPKGTVYAVEIKTSLEPEKESARSLYSFAEICPKAKLMCVAPIEYKRKFKDIDILPWQEFFNLLF